MVLWLGNRRGIESERATLTLDWTAKTYGEQLRGCDHTEYKWTELGLLTLPCWALSDANQRSWIYQLWAHG